MSDSDVPQYLETLEGEIGVDPDPAPITKYVDSMWASNPSLIDKNIEELEQEDRENRQKLLSMTMNDKQQAQTLEQQSEIYKDLLGLTQSLLTANKFAHLPSYTKTLRRSLKEALKLQEVLSKGLVKGKVKRVGKNNQKIWDWVSDLTREWSNRLDLKIGGDLITQVSKEAERTKDHSLEGFIGKELKGSYVVRRNSVKKVKHKSSKHRKLKFDVHEKLMNFMTPEHFELESKHEVLVNSLFSQKLPTKRTRVHLDIPLI